MNGLSGTTRPRRGDIQGLRATAVLLVVLYHAGLGISGGFTGVDVFFVISGFVITTTLLRDLVDTGAIGLSAFYRRRVKRLLPALAVMLVAVAVLATLANPVASQRTTALTGIWSSVFAANGFLYRLGTGYFDVSSSLDPLLHTWTLAVEEQFYLLFPCLLLLAWWLGRRVGRARVIAVVLVAAVTAGSFALVLALVQGDVLASGHRPAQIAFYSSPTRAWEFGVGALIALCGAGMARIRGRLAELLAAAGGAAVLYGAFSIPGTTSFPDASALYPVLGTAAIIAAGTGWSPLVSRALDSRPLVWIGDRSYSWYLWHWPLIVFAKAFLTASGGWVAPAAAAASLLPAAASYRWIENPIRTDRRVRGPRVIAVAAISVLAPIGACGALLGTSHLLARTAPLRDWRQSQAPHLDELHGCQGPTPFGEATSASCTWRVRHARGTIVLIGDSNAAHFSESVVEAGNRARFNVTISTFDGCPFVDLQIVGSSAGEASCRVFETSSLRGLLRARPSLVVTADRTNGYINGHVNLAAPNGPLASSESAKARLWRRGLGAVLSQLNGDDIPVLVVDAVPEIRQEQGACAVLLVLLRSCSASVSRTSVDADLLSGRVVDGAAVAAAPRSRSLDLENDFCSRSRCSSLRHGIPLYRDTNHLSVAGALLVTDRFYRAIRAEARSG